MRAINTQVGALDLNAVTVTLQAVIMPLFWGALATALFVPIAAAGGTFVARKIVKAKK